MSPPLVLSRSEAETGLRLFAAAVEQVATGAGGA
jgi:hypothetical protein